MSNKNRLVVGIVGLAGCAFLVILVAVCTLGFFLLQNQSGGQLAPTKSANATPLITPIEQTVTSSQGGKIQLGDGMSLEIPPDALTRDTRIAIASPNAPPNLGSLTTKPNGIWYEFGPSGTAFTKPARLTLSYKNLDTSRALSPNAVFLARWDGAKWAYVGGTVDPNNKTITAEINSFSIYGVFEILEYTNQSKMATELSDKLSLGPADREMTNIAQGIKAGNWNVVDQKIRNGRSMGNKNIVVDKDWLMSLALVQDLPANKRALMLGAVLGHEIAHDSHGDLNPLQTTVHILVEAAKQKLLGDYDLNRLTAKLQLAMIQAAIEVDLTPVMQVMSEIWHAIKYDNPLCASRHQDEFSADEDGVKWASQTAKNWAPSDESGDLAQQLILIYVSIMNSAGNEDCAHPPEDQRGERIRAKLLSTRNGGFYGTVTDAYNFAVAGVRVSANGLVSVTDAEGKYFLAPLAPGSITLTASKDGCQSISKTGEVRERFLIPFAVQFDCASGSRQATLPFSDDFSTDKGWTNDTKGNFTRDSANKVLNWKVNRSVDEKYYIPIAPYSGDFTFEARVKATAWANNCDFFMGLADSMTSQGNSIFPSGIFVSVGWFGEGVGNRVRPQISYADRSDLVGMDVKIPSTFIRYDLNTWYRIVLQKQSRNWTIAVNSDSGNQIGRITGILPADHKPFTYIMLWNQKDGDWPTGTGLLDDLSVRP